MNIKSMVELHGYKIFVLIWHPYPYVFPQRGEPWLLWLPPKYVPDLHWTFSTAPVSHFR